VFMIALRNALGEGPAEKCSPSHEGKWVRPELPRTSNVELLA